MSDEKLWYVVQTYSGFENKVKQSLDEKIKKDHLEELFAEILVPTVPVLEKGVKRTSKLLPSYIIIRMVMNDRTKSVVKNIPKVSGFVGEPPQETKQPRRRATETEEDLARRKYPPNISDREVQELMAHKGQAGMRPKPRIEFEQGDSVRVIDGPFANFNGVVEEVNPDKGRLKVLVSIFGRSTPVDLDFMQVEKTTD